MNAPAKPDSSPLLLLVDGEVLARTAIASYLRECGYEVIEASDDSDARAFLEANDRVLDIAILAAPAEGLERTFVFARWLREHHNGIHVLVAAGVEKEARLAAEACEEGPHLRKPYEHQALLDWIKRLRA